MTDIPNGWALCDGTNGTPDMRNRFIVGVGSSYGLGWTGGEAVHQLSVAELPSHTHSLSGTSASGTMNLYYGDGSKWSPKNTYVYAMYVAVPGHNDSAPPYMGSNSTLYYTEFRASFSGLTLNGNVASTGSNQAHENRPPYIALYYIMKIK